MDLLIFAHRGEAQAFLEHFPDFKSLKDSVYENSNFRLVICGEGMEKALTQTAFHLGQRSFNRVFNLGITGALDPNLEFKKIYKVRTTYRAQDEKMEFKSFSSDGELDCITSNQRVYSPELARRYSHFADLVDREVWGIGYACNEFKVPFYSYKLVSDFASNEAACEEIKNQAKEFSYQLLNFFLNEDLNQKRENTEESFGLYLTESMRRSFNALKESLEIKHSKPLREIIDLKTFPKDMRPKTKALKVLELMKRKLTPKRFEINETLKSLVKDIESENCKIHFDPQLESNEIRAHLNFSTEAELEELTYRLHKTPFKKIESLLNGEA